MRFEPSGRQRRRPGLTPLIDVVFLLLVFFMLASRFGAEGALPLVVRTAGADTTAQIDVLRVVVGDDGSVRIDERVVPLDALVAAALRAKRDDRKVVLAAAPAATLQRIVDTLAALEKGGVSDVALERQGAR